MKWKKIKETIRKNIQSIQLNPKILLTLLAVASILLISLFIAINQPNFPSKGESHAPVQETLPDQPETAAEKTENESPEQVDKTPQQDSIADPIPETPVIEATNEAGNIIVAHSLPNDMEGAPAEQYTAHFARWEFVCDGNDCSGFPVEMDPVLLEKLEALRCALGRPVIITSGVRCASRNATVGGIAGSRHLSGQAADLYCPGVHYADVARVARAQGLWVLEYPNEQYIHVEV